MRIKNNKKKKLIICSCCGVVAAGLIYFFVTRDQPVSTVFEYEDNVVVGLMPGVDRQALLDEMQKNVDETAIAYSINGRPQLNSKYLDILFENPEGNNKDLAIEIFDNETGDSIYESKAIKEGHYLSLVEVSKEYSSGDHIITVYIRAYNTKTHDFIGEAAAELIMTVE